MTDLFTGIAAICEKLIALISARQLHQRQFFEIGVEPVFQHLLRIHENYLTTFNDINLVLADADISPKAVRERMYLHQQELAHVRSLVARLNDTLLSSWYSKPKKTNKNAGVREVAFSFAYAVHDYFRGTTGEPPPFIRGGTWITGFIGVLDALVEGHLSREEALDSAARVLNELPMKWNVVATHYATLRGLSYGLTEQQGGGYSPPATRSSKPTP